MLCILKLIRIDPVQTFLFVQKSFPWIFPLGSIQIDFCLHFACGLSKFFWTCFQGCGSGCSWPVSGSDTWEEEKSRIGPSRKRLGSGTGSAINFTLNFGQYVFKEKFKSSLILEVLWIRIRCRPFSYKDPDPTKTPGSVYANQRIVEIVRK